MRDIPINPELPEEFYSTPNDERSLDELEEWWFRPFITGQSGAYAVHCLDGGAWDRPTLLGVFSELGEALDFAKSQ